MKTIRLKTIQVKVKPSARSSALDELPDGTWVAQLTSPPVDGKANEELIALIAKRFKCRKANVEISSGAGARLKLVKIALD